MKDAGFYPTPRGQSQQKNRAIKQHGATPLKNVAPAKAAYSDD
jgi:hypothetical protein